MHISKQDSLKKAVLFSTLIQVESKALHYLIMMLESSVNWLKTPVNDDNDNKEPITSDKLRGNDSSISRHHNYTSSVLTSETLLQLKRAIIINERTFVRGIIRKKPPEFKSKKQNYIITYN